MIMFMSIFIILHSGFVINLLMTLPVLLLDLNVEGKVRHVINYVLIQHSEEALYFKFPSNFL